MFYNEVFWYLHCNWHIKVDLRATKSRGLSLKLVQIKNLKAETQSLEATCHVESESKVKFKIYNTTLVKMAGKFKFLSFEQKINSKRDLNVEVSVYIYIMKHE